MGKVSSGWINGGGRKDEDDPDEKRRKLRRDLDQVRKNALGRKRDLRKDSNIHKPKSGLMRTLNQFASQRRKLEDATQITNLINKPKIIKPEVIQPRDLRGFFAAGIKGKQLTRPDPVYEKYKKAVLQNDPLQLLQSNTHYQRPQEIAHRSSTKSPIEDDHAELKMEVSKILNNIHSSESSSFDLDEPGTIEFPSSPVIGKHNGTKKKVNHVKAAANEENRLHPQEKEVPFVNNVNRAEKYKRRLFDTDLVRVHNKHKEVNDALHNNGALRKSMPENVIFYSEVVSKELVHNNNKKRSKIDHLCADQDIIEYYEKVCKFFGQNDLKNMFRFKYKDPEIKAKEALKLTYKRSLKEYVSRQNCQTKSVDQTTPSSNSEVLVEPDSAIARVVKKNALFLKQKQSSASNSTDSTKNFVSKVDAQLHNPSTVATVDNNIAKRKRVPSSKGSEPEAPLSTKAMVDPRSVRADSKMNMIHPYRQEIVARFLEDQKSFNNEASQEIPERHVRKDKLYMSNDFEATYLMQKSTRYVPAILRRNRSLADCIEKEKAALLRMEKYPSQSNHNSSTLDLDLDNIESEHTPNTVIEPLLEAPKCKYAHANAKYNQPSRINIPMVQESRHHRNPLPERHSRRAPSPNGLDQSFTLSQPYHMSPIKQYSSYTDSGLDHHHFQPSQESQLSDTGQCMSRMVSFGDIQDRTNRLTICSQNQQCSQESMDHAYASQRSSCHHQPCESTSNRNNHYQPSQQPRRVTFAEPTSYHERPSFVERPTATYVPPNNEYSCHDSSVCGCCRQEPAATRQPVKFHAAEGNRRHPIYQPGESCPYVHKQPPCYSSVAADSSDYEYHDMLKMNYGGGGGGGDRPQSFVVAPPNGNQRYVVQRQMPVSPPPPPAVCQQVAHRHGHCAANEACKMNDAYLHQMNRMHSKRQ